MKKLFIGIFIGLLITSLPLAYAATTGMLKFSDVDSSDWFAQDVEMMSNFEILKGNPDGTYAPEKSLNRAEAAAISNRLVNYIRTRELLAAMIKWADQMPADIIIDRESIVKGADGNERDLVTMDAFRRLYKKVENISPTETSFEPLEKCISGFELGYRNEYYMYEVCSDLGNILFSFLEVD